MLPASPGILPADSLSWGPFLAASMYCGSVPTFATFADDALRFFIAVALALPLPLALALACPGSPSFLLCVNSPLYRLPPLGWLCSVGACVRACAVVHGADLARAGAGAALKDYYVLNFTMHLDDPACQGIMNVVDPYMYLDRYTFPKFVINAGGDEFFLYVSPSRSACACACMHFHTHSSLFALRSPPAKSCTHRLLCVSFLARDLDASLLAARYVTTQSLPQPHLHLPHPHHSSSLS